MDRDGTAVGAPDAARRQDGPGRWDALRRSADRLAEATTPAGRMPRRNAQPDWLSQPQGMNDVDAKAAPAACWAGRGPQMVRGQPTAAKTPKSVAPSGVATGTNIIDYDGDVHVVVVPCNRGEGAARTTAIRSGGPAHISPLRSVPYPVVARTARFGRFSCAVACTQVVRANPTTSIPKPQIFILGRHAKHVASYEWCAHFEYREPNRFERTREKRPPSKVSEWDPAYIWCVHQK